MLGELSSGSTASYTIRYAAGFEGMLMVLSGMCSVEQLAKSISFMNNFQLLNGQELFAIDKVRKTITA